MLLNGRLELHGVDAEGLSRRALDDSLRSRGAHLSREEYEDALSYVISELWRLSLDYDPERTASFATFGYRRGGFSRSTGSGSGSAAPSGSSETAAPMLASVPTFSHSMPTVPGEIDWTRLSERGQAILRTIALPISAGFSPGEIASELGTSTSWVSSRMDELRNELKSLPT